MTVDHRIRRLEKRAGAGHLTCVFTVEQPADDGDPYMIIVEHKGQVIAFQGASDERLSDVIGRTESDLKSRFRVTHVFMLPASVRSL